MPITYEPAQPAAFNTVARYGQMTAPLAPATQAALGMQERQAAINAQFVEGQSAIASQDFNQGENRRLQGDLYAMSRQVSPRDVYEANARLDQQRQHVELMAWANNQDMTQAEVLKLQRQKQAVAAVMDRTDWTDQEKADAITQLRTGIDVGQKRLQATQQRKIEQDVQMDAARTKTLLAKEQAIASARTQTLDQAVQWRIDPNHQAELEEMLGPEPPAATIGGAAAQVADRSKRLQALAGKMGVLLPYRQDPETGAWEPVKYERKKGEGANDLPPGAMTQQQYHSLRRQAELDADKYIADQRAAAAKANPPLPAPNIDRDAIVRQHLDAIGIRPTYQEQIGRRPAGGQPTAPGQGQPQPAPREAVATIDQTVSDFNARPVPPEVKAAVVGALEQSKALLARRGAYDKLDATEKAIYDHNRELVRRALATAPPPVPPAPAAPPALRGIVRPALPVEPNLLSS